MNCKESVELQHAHLDGELDPVRSVEFEEHIKTCAACAAAARNLQGLRSAVRSDELYYRAPSALRRRIRANLRHEESVPSVAELWLSKFWRRLAGVGFAATLACLLILGVIRPSPTDRLAQEVASSHVRSLMAEHLADVLSTDQHTVKPWFDGRVDFAPPVVNLTDHGFPLYGGRLDYLDNHPVAAVVYKRMKHDINLFIWPAAAGGDSSAAAASYRGYNLVHWRAGGMNCWAASDLNPGELREFADLIRAQTQPAPKQ